MRYDLLHCKYSADRHYKYDNGRKNCVHILYLLYILVSTVHYRKFKCVMLAMASNMCTPIIQQYTVYVFINMVLSSISCNMGLFCYSRFVLLCVYAKALKNKNIRISQMVICLCNTDWALGCFCLRTTMFAQQLLSAQQKSLV